MKAEINRRRGNAAKIVDLFRAQPGVWIGAHQLAQVGGFCAWRTRVSDARDVFEAEGGVLEWNEKPRESAYRYLPQKPQGRDAGEQVPAPWNQDRPFAEPFRLTPPAQE